MSLPFRPASFVALGSPLGLFLSIRNNAHTLRFGDKINNENNNNSSSQSQSLSHTHVSMIEDVVISQCFTFPTCSTFYNIFHPHDPVAYRIEPLLDPALFSKGPVIVVHHKGGLRPHYIIKNVANQISDAVSMVLNPVAWWNSSTTSASSATSSSSKNTPNLSTSPPSTSFLSSALIPSSSTQNETTNTTSSSSSTSSLTTSSKRSEEYPVEVPHIALNGGRRVDFMLQETGLENANEYISSITSHTGYFDMKDVARFIVVNIWK